MTIERFKNTWQPPMDSYERVCFNLDLKELEQQIRTEVIDKCIDILYEVTPQTIDEKLDMVFINALQDLKEESK